jgi:hypothetical protein
MFGRPANATPTSPGSAASNPDAGEPRPAGRGQRPIPPGLVPWLTPLLIVVVIVIGTTAPIFVAVPGLVLLFGSIVVALFRATKGQTYEDLRRTDPLYRGLDDFRRRRGYRGLDGDGPAR